MDCLLSGIVGIGLLAATFSTLTVSDEQHETLRRVLSDDLDLVYTNIANERRNLYIVGLVIGLLLTFVALKTFPGGNMFQRLTSGLGITLLTAVIYYSVIPKSDYMLNHLKSAQEITAWLDVYKTMNGRYHIGFLLGALVAIPFSYIMCVQSKATVY